MQIHELTNKQLTEASIADTIKRGAQAVGQKVAQSDFVQQNIKPVAQTIQQGNATSPTAYASNKQAAAQAMAAKYAEKLRQQGYTGQRAPATDPTQEPEQPQQQQSAATDSGVKINYVAPDSSWNNMEGINGYQGQLWLKDKQNNWFLWDRGNPIPEKRTAYINKLNQLFAQVDKTPNAGAQSVSTQPATTQAATAQPAGAASTTQPAGAVNTNRLQAQAVQTGGAPAVMLANDFNAALAQMNLTTNHIAALKAQAAQNPSFANALAKSLGLK